MYLKHCKLSDKEQLRLMEHFVAGTPARSAADLVGVHRNSAVRFFHKLRAKIALELQNRSEQFCGKIELDESYFGGVRKGKRGRGAAGKVPVFGILKRGGRVYTQIIGDAKSETLLPIIREKIMPDSIVYTDSFRSYSHSKSKIPTYNLLKREVGEHAPLFDNGKRLLDRIKVRGVSGQWKDAMSMGFNQFFNGLFVMKGSVIKNQQRRLFQLW
jgi:transposase-like protein